MGLWQDDKVRLTSWNTTSPHKTHCEIRGLCDDRTSQESSISCNKFVIPTGAHPDFLLRGTTDGCVCGFL
jgi:hypothetical protein